jgi:hypothetical protein
VKNRKRRDLNPAKQALALRAAFPDATQRVRPNGLTWIGKLQPTALSIEYTVRIEYVMGKSPRVTVLNPPLEPPPGGRLRHMYPGKRLCLHYPEQWSGDMLIARTIVPWASEWLLHHELLRATGEWHGGGHEPPAMTSR